MEHALTNIYNMIQDDWDHKIPTVSWAYHTICKNLTGQTLIRLVYGQEDFIPMEYIVPSLRINSITEMKDVGTIEEILSQVLQLEEYLFIISYHQRVEKERQKSWHDHRIKFKQSHPGYFTLLYDNKFLKHPGKLCTHLLGPYVVIHVTDGHVVQLQYLAGTPFDWLVNGSRPKP